MKRTLERELKVLEIVEGEAHGRQECPAGLGGALGRHPAPRWASQQGLGRRDTSRDCSPVACRWRDRGTNHAPIGDPLGGSAW